MTAFGGTSYSASVRIWLEYATGRILLAQAAPSFVVPVVPQDLEPCDAKIVVEIDGECHQRPVTLINGLCASKRKATVLAQDTVAPF